MPFISSGALRGEAGGAEGAVGRDRAAYFGTKWKVPLLFGISVNWHTVNWHTVNWHTVNWHTVNWHTVNKHMYC